jgi:carbonic anhydrase
VKKYLASLFLVILSSSAVASTWGYTLTNGPMHWAKKFPLCAKGYEQTPINISPSEVITKQDLPAIKTHFIPTAMRVTNNGHTIKIVPLTTNTLTIGNKTYRVLQFHFHHFSETTINHKHYPMEAHIVTQSKEGKFAVIGIFFKSGQANPFLAKIWKKMPKRSGKSITLKQKINLTNLLPQKLSYYHFKGSLTTPPCTEGIQWYVLTTPAHASYTQINTFSAIYPNNYRPVQPLLKRIIEKS